MALWTNLEPIANSTEKFLQWECCFSLYATALWTFWILATAQWILRTVGKCAQNIFQHGLKYRFLTKDYIKSLSLIGQSSWFTYGAKCNLHTTLFLLLISLWHDEFHYLVGNLFPNSLPKNKEVLYTLKGSHRMGQADFSKNLPIKWT